MARTKQGARITSAGRAPRMQLATKQATKRNTRATKTSPVTAAPAPASSAKKGADKTPSMSQQLEAERAQKVELTAQLHKLQAQIDAQRRMDANAVEFEAKRLLQQQQLNAVLAPPAAAACTPEPSSSTDGADAAASASASVSVSSASSSSSAPCPVVRPCHWPSHQSHHVQLQTLSSDDPDFKMAASMLASSGLPKAVMLSVQRIYNRPLWDRYVQARERVMQKKGNEQLNNPVAMGGEKLLWHGTRHNQPHLIYSNAEGFDTRCAGNGMLGPGMYFSRSAQYSGQSYAHSLTGQPNYGYYGSHQATKPAIPPLFSVTPAGKLKVSKLPPQSFQMFLARVVLGTEYDARKGQPSGGYYNGRPPIRPFNCPSCKVNVDLEKINLDTLRSSLGEGRVLEAGEEEEGEAPLGDTVPAKGTASRKRKRGSAAVAAPAAAAAGAAPAVSAPVTPLRKSSRRSVNASPASSAAAAAPVAPPTPAQAPLAAAAAVAPLAPAAAPAPGLDALASVSADAAPADASSSSAAPAAVSAASSSASSAPLLPFDAMPVPCPKCSCCLGTRSQLLAAPQRYDSVTSDHMSVVYESAMAYPEFLCTYQLNP